MSLAATKQLFEDVECWKPRLIVAHFPDWTREVFELALEVVRRQRAGGRDILLRYPINTTMPFSKGHVEAQLHLVCGTLDGRVAGTSQRTPRFWWAATMRALARRLSESVQQESSAWQTLVSFLHLDKRSEDLVKSHSCVHVAERTSEPILTPIRFSFDDTKLDPSDRKALTPGITTAFRRLHVNLGHPTNDDLTRCLAAGGGSRVAQTAVTCVRCSTRERMSRPRSEEEDPQYVPMGITDLWSPLRCCQTTVTPWKMMLIDVDKFSEQATKIMPPLPPASWFKKTETSKHTGMHCRKFRKRCNGDRRLGLEVWAV